MQVGKGDQFCDSCDSLNHPVDVMVHRQLAASIGYSSLHASLHSKGDVERALEVINRRHRMAQMAGRASVEFYVGLALKVRGEKSIVRDEAFVVRTFRNGLGVFVSKYVQLLVDVDQPDPTHLGYPFCRLGLEGLVMFKGEPKYDPNNYTLTVPSPENRDVTLSVFDKITVEIEVEKDKNTQRGKVKMTLVDPPVVQTL